MCTRFACNIQKNGYRGKCHCNKEQTVAHGDQLDENTDFELFKGAYRVNRARYRNVKQRTRQITAEVICDHAEHFRFGCANIEVMDIVLHSICVLSLILGL